MLKFAIFGKKFKMAAAAILLKMYIFISRELLKIFQRKLENTPIWRHETFQNV